MTQRPSSVSHLLQQPTLILCWLATVPEYQWLHTPQMSQWYSLPMQNTPVQWYGPGMTVQPLQSRHFVQRRVSSADTKPCERHGSVYGDSRRWRCGRHSMDRRMAWDRSEQVDVSRVGHALWTSLYTDHTQTISLRDNACDCAGVSPLHSTPTIHILMSEKPQAVKVIWQSATMPPCTECSIIFARWCQ